MRVIIQRISKGKIAVEGEWGSEIGPGLMVLVGVANEDGQEDVEWLVKKILSLRIFSDEEGKMNRSVEDIDGAIGVVSQFTLHAKTKKGTRPSFIRAAAPDKAEQLYLSFVEELRKSGRSVETGKFGAHMELDFVNDGPVTIFIDTENKE